MSSDEGSVTLCISKLKAGDHGAAVLLWRRYFQQLVRVARRNFPGKARAAADEEDIALNAFANFCHSAEQGHLPKVRDRSDLWRLLLTLAIRMGIDQVRREGRQKRGSAFRETAHRVDPAHLASNQPDPSFMAQVAEECDRLLAGLDDETLKSIAMWKTEGYSNEEIAAKLGVVLRTVERKLHVIRQLWASEDQHRNSY